MYSMTRNLFFSILSLILLSSQYAMATVTITSFGTGPTATSGWTYNNGDLSGSSTSGDSLLETFGSAADITGFTKVALDLTPVDNVDPGTSFTFLLEESLGGTGVAEVVFSATQLNSGSATSTLTDLGGDFANVGSFRLTLGGLPGETFNVSLNSLSAVPEPSAFALIAGCFALAWVTVRRRA